MIWSEYFSRLDFACPCCDKCHMSQCFIDQLVKARRLAGIPFYINSGFRCVEHNASLPGSSRTSSHMIGLAADISTPSSRQKFIIVKSLLQVGFTRLFLYRTFIHVDNDINKVQKVMRCY